MGKLKEHFHEQITYEQQNADNILDAATRINIKVLITLALINLKHEDFEGGTTTFYLSRETIKDIERIRDELDRL